MHGDDDGPPSADPASRDAPRVPRALRAAECAVGGLAGLLAAPLVLALGVLLLLDSRGPLLHAEVRLGRHGRSIRVPKLRTLRHDAAGGSRVAVAGDPRITRVGAWLRRHHLDELPQLFSVAAGRMALIGPRPEPAGLWSGIDPDLRQRGLAVRPGLVSPAGLRYLCEDAVLAEYVDPEHLYRRHLFPAKLRHDLRYLARRGPRTDLRLLARAATRVTGLHRREARACPARVRARLPAHARLADGGSVRADGGISQAGRQRS